MRDSKILGVQATGSFGTGLSDDVAASDNSAAPSINAPAPGDDSLSSLQWDMVQIHAPEARAINGGSPSIVVGDIELTGIYEIIKESNGQAKVWNFPADQVSEVGTLTVNIVIPTPIPTLTPGPYPEPTAYPNP